MSNFIALGPEDALYMSNGLTDVFLNVLILSGSALARTEGEKRLIVWLGEHDQNRLGRGAVGFDIQEMPWDLRTFQDDRAFLLRASAAAREHLGWERLDYIPDETLLLPCLDRFTALLSRLEERDIQPEILPQWLADAELSDPVRRGFPLCPRHGALLTVFGCQLCGN